MFGIGMPELIIILVVALLVLGPKKLPDVAKGLARGIGEFKKATNELKKNIDLDEDLREIKDTFDEEVRRTMSESDIDAGAQPPIGSPPEETAEEKARREKAAEEVYNIMDGDEPSEDSETDGAKSFEEPADEKAQGAQLEPDNESIPEKPESEAESRVYKAGENKAG